MQQLHNPVACKTKFHLLLVKHSGTTSMEVEVHIQNHLGDPPPDYLLRKTNNIRILINDLPDKSPDFMHIKFSTFISNTGKKLQVLKLYQRISFGN